MNALLPGGAILMCVAMAGGQTPGKTAPNSGAIIKVPAGAAVPASYPAITIPFKRQEASLKVLDIVLKLNVKTGDVVKMGDVLLVEDDREERINLEIIKLEAESETAIKSAEAAMEVKKIERDRIKNAKPGSFSEQELLRAEGELTLATLDIDKAKMEHKQKIKQAERQAVTIDRMRVISKIDGIVKEINVHEGEVVDPQKPAIIIVQNNPLKVETHLPVSISLDLMRQKDKNPGKDIMLGVLYPGAKAPLPAKVIFFSPEADAGSDTQLVQLELKNDEGIPSGLNVEVIVPQGSNVAQADGK